VVARPIDAETDIDPSDLVSLVQYGVVTPDDSIEDFVRARFRLPKRTGPRPAPVPPKAPVAPSAGPVAAARRHAHMRMTAEVRAATAKTWKTKVAEALSGSVDASAIAAAVKDGKTPAQAVAAGLDPDDTTALATVLVDLWNDAYDRGATRATDAVSRTAAARRTTPVRASLSDMVAKAADIASDILSSLADRLASALGRDDAPTDTSDLESLLDGLGVDGASAERIADTESQRAMVAGSVDTWASMGVAETRWVRSSGSDVDDECGDLDGTTATDWDELPPLHPNCQCDLEPVDDGAGDES
jgi:hypothetical protein